MFQTLFLNFVLAVRLRHRPRHLAAGRFSGGTLKDDTHLLRQISHTPHKEAGAQSGERQETRRRL